MACWLVVLLLLAGAAHGQEGLEIQEPERMTLEELLRLQDVVNEVLSGRPPAPVPDLVDPGVVEPEGEPEAGEDVVEDELSVPVLERDVPGEEPPPMLAEPPGEAPVVEVSPDDVVEGIGVDVFLGEGGPVPGVLAPEEEPLVMPPVAEEPLVVEETPAARPDDLEESLVLPPAAAFRSELRLGERGAPVRLRQPREAYLREVPRGTLGYRLPLVVKQRVAPRVVNGVFIPAHDAWVVLRKGYWELGGDVESPLESLAWMRRTAPVDTGVVQPREQPHGGGFWQRLWRGPN